jgi:hypothetical protein
MKTYPLHAQREIRKNQVMKATKGAEKQSGLGVARASGALPASVRMFACFPPF